MSPSASTLLEKPPISPWRTWKVGSDGGSSHELTPTDPSSVPAFVLEHRPSAEFGVENGRRRLTDIDMLARTDSQIDLMVPGEADGYEIHGDHFDPGFTTRQARLVRLSGMVDLESEVSVGCAGAVLAYLHRYQVAKSLPAGMSDKWEFKVSTIEMFTLGSTM